MSAVRPFTDAHAIVHVDIGIGFESALQDDDVQILRKGLDKALLSEGFTRNAEDEGKGIHASYARVDADGGELEELHIHPSHVHLVHRDYRGWSYTRGQILRRLEPVLTLAGTGALRAEALILDIRDAFVYEDPALFKVGEIFRDSGYLPHRVNEWGQRWRTTLDFMVDFSEGDGSVVTRTHLDAGLVEARDGEESHHLTDIYHRQAFIRNKDADCAVEWSERIVVDRLDWMHAKNKALLLELLVDDLAVRIGLKEIEK